MKKLYYLSVQPATLYYAWQVEVMLDNFLEMGVSADQIQLLMVSDHGVVPIVWRKLEAKYKDVQFHYYADTRPPNNYIPSIKLNLMKQHFYKHPELSKHAIFFHDCDILFTKPVDWSPWIQDDVWYLSDTTNYIGANYIKSKGHDIYERMCDIVGIDPKIPIENEPNSGGAQYILKNVDATFWDKAEMDSYALYNFFVEDLTRHPQTADYVPIQKWTAEMWSTLWNGWYFGHHTKVIKEMDFGWPHHPTSSWVENPIFHNSGVSGNEEKIQFFKAGFTNKLPYDIPDIYDTRLASYKYFEAVKRTGSSSCLYV